MTIEEIQYEAQGIMQEWGSNDSTPYVEFVEKLASMKLSEPSLPSNLDEAANRQAALEQPYKWEEEQDGFFGVTPLFVMSNIRSAFKAGAEWMAGQGVTDAIEGEICGRVRDHINVKFQDGVGLLLTPAGVSHIPADVLKYNIGDNVIVQIRKE